MKNKYKVVDDIAYIQMSDGYVCTVSADDLHRLSEVGTLNAMIDTDGSVRAVRARLHGKEIRLHRHLLDNPVGVIDHMDRNPLNNCRSNLRVVSHSENAKNCPIRRDNPWGVKGVRKHKSRWNAWIQVEGRKKSLGVYDTMTEAARARVRAEVMYYNSCEVQRTPIKL